MPPEIVLQTLHPLYTLPPLSLDYPPSTHMTDPPALPTPTFQDVLIATDVASKGLDFQNVQHVINYDMPEEIENYVHRIGRTGRRGKTGLATTFINKAQSESILLDLKHLLREAKQRIPPVLQALHDPMDELRVRESEGVG